MTSTPGLPRPLPDFLRRGDPALGRPGLSSPTRIRAAFGLPAHPGSLHLDNTPQGDARFFEACRHWASLVERGLIGAHLKGNDKEQE